MACTKTGNGNGNGNGDKLTAKQEQFCLEYMIDLNATQASIRAGYSANGANVTGAQNLAKPSIQKKLQELKKKKIRKAIITAEEVLNGLAQITRDEEENTRDRIRAYEMIGKHLGMFPDTVHHHVHPPANVKFSDA